MDERSTQARRDSLIERLTSPHNLSLDAARNVMRDQVALDTPPSGDIPPTALPSADPERALTLQKVQAARTASRELLRSQVTRIGA